MSENKKFTIVSFTQEGQVEVVPTSWLVGEESTRWPNTGSLSTVTKYIRDCKVPEENWSVISTKILGFAKSFKSANRKATIAMDTSNIGSDSSLSEMDNTLNIRKRARPSRFQSSSDDDINVETKRKCQKKFPAPSAPSFKNVVPSSSKVFHESQDPLSVSLIAPNYSPRPTTQDGNSMPALFARVFKYMEQMKNVLKTLKEDQTRMRYEIQDALNKKEPIQGLVTLPDGIVLPLETDVQLLQFNFSLQEDKSLITALARYLHGSCTGKSISSFLLSVTKRLLHQDVAVQYSRLGRKGKKNFEQLEEIYNAILAAAGLKFPETAKEVIAEKFGRILASAPEWEGARAKAKKMLNDTDLSVIE